MFNQYIVMSVGNLFCPKGAVQFVNPFFHRVFVWEPQHLKIFMDDLFRLYHARSLIREKWFIGTIVVRFVKDDDRSETFEIIDGFQRLTAISLILHAASMLMNPMDAQTSADIHSLLFNPSDEGMMKYKLLPSRKNNDRQAYVQLLDGQAAHKKSQSAIPSANSFIAECLKTKIRDESIDIGRLIGVMRLYTVCIWAEVDRRQNPARLYEMINRGGCKLSDID